MNEMDTHPSPHWSPTTKLVAGLTMVAVLAFMLIRFQNILAPLILTFILAYLFYPLADALRRWFRLPWRLAVTFIYLVLVIILLSLLTVGGFALFTQIQSLINFVQQALVSLPDFLQSLSQQHFTIGPFQFNFTQLDIGAVTNNILGVVQPLLGQMGGMVGQLASGAASVFGWMAFVVLVSYFMLAETGGNLGRLVQVNLPGYDFDLKRLGSELSHIWDAFLRGQLILTTIWIIVFSILLSVLGMHYILGLALLTGLANKFIPYVGAWISWTTFALVALFQGSTIFGLSPWVYAAVVVAISIVIDGGMDNLLTPRIMARALKVNPAAVLVAALIGLNILGLIGAVLAAPVLATLKLFTEYVINKMLDRNPWAHINTHSPQSSRSMMTFLKQTWQMLVNRFKKNQQGMAQPPDTRGK